MIMSRAQQVSQCAHEEGCLYHQFGDHLVRSYDRGGECGESQELVGIQSLIQ